MAALVRPSSTSPDLQALITALGQLLVPEYLRQKTGPLEYPSAPGKMPSVENDPMATSAFGGLDLIGNLMPGGGAKLLATPLAGAAWKGLAEQAAWRAKATIPGAMTTLEKQATNPFNKTAPDAQTAWRAKATIPDLMSVLEKQETNPFNKAPAESIAPATNWAEEIPAAFKKSIEPVMPKKQLKMTPEKESGFGIPDETAMLDQLQAIQDALAGPTPGAKPTLAKAAIDFPNPNIPPVPDIFQQVPFEHPYEHFGTETPVIPDPVLNAFDLEQAKLLMPKNPVSEPERQARMAASPYQTPTFHGTHSPFEGNTVSGGQFFSTTNPKLSEMYAGDEPMFDNYVPQIMPLRLDTSKYHSYDAEGQTWDQVNRTAINEARAKNAPGVEIRNVLDEPQSGSHSDYKEKLPPQTVYITLEPNTIRSDKAQFDPSKFHLNDLLAALGLGLLAPGAMGGSNAGK